LWLQGPKQNRYVGIMPILPPPLTERPRALVSLPLPLTLKGVLLEDALPLLLLEPADDRFFVTPALDFEFA
jgi:hypothetical protein